MKTLRLHALAVALFFFVSPAAHAAEAAGKWPDKVVRLVVATAPGGGDDFIMRLLAPKLSEIFKQQFIVENRAGAGGVIGQTYVLKSPPDGYTWLLAGGSMAGAKYVNLMATYNVLKDFTPVSLVETSQFAMVVHPSVPAKNTKEYIALARSQPGKMTYGTIGAGQIPYWSVILFNNMAGVKAVEVQYKGSADALTDIISGRIDYYFPPTVQALSLKDRLKVLAVTSAKRSPVMPDVPTMAESALAGYDMPAWRSIMGPAGVRPEIVTALNAALARVLEMPDVKEKYAVAGSETLHSPPDQVLKWYEDWIGRFGKIAKQAGLKPM